MDLISVWVTLSAAEFSGFFNTAKMQSLMHTTPCFFICFSFNQAANVLRNYVINFSMSDFDVHLIHE